VNDDAARTADGRLFHARGVATENDRSPRVDRLTVKNKHGDTTSLDMYRGITLLPVISKSVLLELFNDFLKTDNLQFGFKKNSSCSHALFAFTESVKYFVNNSSKVYGAFLRRQ